MTIALKVTTATFLLLAAILWVGVKTGLASDLHCDKIGPASFYGIESCVKPPPHCRTANGDKFTGEALTAAMVSPSHIGERWRVTYIGTKQHPGTGKSVIVRINDTGGFAKYGRIMDLSRAAAARIGLIHAGVGVVCAARL